MEREAEGKFILKSVYVHGIADQLTENNHKHT